MLENICLQCTLWFIGSGLIGLILGRLLFGGKSKQLVLAQEENVRSKSDFDRLLNDFKNFKSTATKDLEKKDVEIFKLKKGGASGSSSFTSDDSKWQKKSEKMAKEIIGLKLELEKKNAYNAELSAKDQKSFEKKKEKVSHLKSKVAELKARLEEESRKSVTAENEVVSLHAELDNAQKKIKKQDTLILEAKSESFVKPQQDDNALKAKDEEINKLKNKIKKQDTLLLEAKRESFNRPEGKIDDNNKKKIKSLKKEISGYKQRVKKLKGKLKQSMEQVEVVERIDLKKLNSLIKNGTLISKKVLKK